jgi:hypothetical protein
MPWPMEKGMINQDRIACPVCGLPIIILNHVVKDRKTGMDYILCKKCQTKIHIIVEPFQEWTDETDKKAFVPYKETK